MMAGQIPTPVVEYEANGLLLHCGSSDSGYSWQEVDYGVAPAFAPVVFKNYTGANNLVDTWSWKASSLRWDSEARKDVEDETITSSEKDFVLNTVGDEYYSVPELVGSYQGVSSEPYAWGLMNGNCKNAYIYAGATSSSFQFSTFCNSRQTTQWLLFRQHD